MQELIFEFWQCTGRTLFKPVNENAEKILKHMKKLNLKEDEIEFYMHHGYDIKLRPRISFKESIRGLVE